MAAVILVSSCMTLFLMGTLKSTLIKTRFPFISISLIVFFEIDTRFILRLLDGNKIGNIYDVNCKDYLFPPTGGKKLKNFTRKIVKTDFLLIRHFLLSKAPVIMIPKIIKLAPARVFHVMTSP